MLSEREQQEIEEEIGIYPHRHAGAVDALKVLQRHRGGWVSDDGVREVAEYLGMTIDEVEAVATFYNMVFRRPVGRHVILICDSVSCWITGYHPLLARLRDCLKIELGGTTTDGRFTLLPVACLGACERAPALLIDGVLHGELTPEQVEALLAQYP